MMLVNKFRRLVRPGFVDLAIADQAIVSGANFVLGIMCARLLGMAEFGRLTLALLMVEFTCSIQFACVLQPMLFVAAKQRDDELPAYFGSLIIQQLGFGVAASILMWAGASAAAMLFPDWELDSLSVPLAAAVFAVQWQNFTRRYFFARERAMAAFVNDALRYSMQIASILVIVRTLSSSVGCETFLWMVVFGSMAANVHGALRIDRTIVASSAFCSSIERHWRLSRWLLPSTLLQWASSQAYQFVVGAVLGVAAAGAMRAALGIVGVLHILMLALQNFAAVQASRALD